MAKTKAQLIKEVKELQEQRHTQYKTIMALQEELEGAQQERDSKAQQLQMNQDRVFSLERDLDEAHTLTAAARRAATDAQRQYNDEHEEHVRTQRSRYEKQQRIDALQKLLVHNGKAIGALSELAAEKYKNDELPF